MERLQRGEKEASALIRQVGRYFGVAVTNVIHLFNPDILVVGGSTATYPGYWEAAMEAVEMYTLPDFQCLLHDHKTPRWKRIVALGAMGVYPSAPVTFWEYKKEGTRL